MVNFLQDIPLSEYTTIGLGGKARYFVSCKTVPEIREALTLARERSLKVQILGGGSNIIFPDEMFNGLVLKVDLGGVSLNEENNGARVTASAGENWDGFVKMCIDHDLCGVECLSGIPGLVGATPIQNVGAYGQEVSDTILTVRALDTRTFQEVIFKNEDCGFRYRQSRFKSTDQNRYVITAVMFSLKRNFKPTIRYPELQKQIDLITDLKALKDGRQFLNAIRTTVLALRKGKSMVVDPSDPNSRSVGSFFMNPVLSTKQFEDFRERWKESGDGSPISAFTTEEGMKVPAAWLVEKAGFRKGYHSGGVGISANHSLALINRSGTTKELLDLAADIQQQVHHKFSILLEREPVVVQ